MSGVGPNERSSWRDNVVVRSRNALEAATAVADRLALLRTLTWLGGGRLDLAEIGVELSGAERDLCSRFGLAVSTDQVLRLLHTDSPAWWPELHVAPGDRRSMVPGFADAILLRFTPNRAYRSQAQKAAVRALMTQPAGSGLMASLPTGAGKSLLFQLAPMVGRAGRPGACVAVITPTIALALDHERSLSGIPGLEGSRALTGDQPRATSQAIVDAFRRGEVPVLLLGPEAALRSDVAAALAEAAQPDAAAFGLEAKLTHLFVDEAHIVESWGRGFRPDFQRLPGLLGRLREADPTIRLVLLSATLTPAARTVLRDGWGAGRPWLEVDARVPRYEHDVIVEPFASAADRLEGLAWAVDHAPRPAIVYTTEIEQASTLHRWLTMERGYRRTALFTGETSSDQRRSIVARWAADNLDIVVATSAFGLGVDKADVRSVIHACLPEGPARWYQEIGRAARDGGQGVAALLFTSTASGEDDVYRARGLAVGGWLTRDLAEKRWAAMLDAARDKRMAPDGFHLTIDLDAVREGLRPASSDYNRGWNMALLTLLQRAGAVEIRSVTAGDDDVGKVWSVRVLDTGLLDASPASWDRVFLVREAEVERARSDIRPFIRLAQRPTRDCITRAAFELIEPTAYAPPCGRCPACRADGIPPPIDLPCGGLDAVWNTASPYAGPLPTGALLLEADDPSFHRLLDTLVRALVDAGVEQFVVPDHLAEQTAEFLAMSDARIGLVLAQSELTAENLPARLATAILVPAGVAIAASDLARMVGWAQGEPFPVVIVAEGARVVGERRLDQWASRFAPMTQNWLIDRAKEGAMP